MEVMNMKQFDVKDNEAAIALAARLSNVGEQMNSVCATMKKVAEDVLVLDQTAHLNEQLSDYLKEAATNLEGLVPGLEEAGKQLTGIVNSAVQFAEAAAGNALGNV